MAQEVRWQYRFRNFARAFSLLSEALEGEVEDLNDLEREGVIQRFEHTFELSWNTLKDRLEYDGVIMQSFTPRNVIRTAVATGLVSDGQTWMNMLEDRRNTSHRYDMRVIGICDLQHSEQLSPHPGGVAPAHSRPSEVPQ